MGTGFDTPKPIKSVEFPVLINPSESTVTATPISPWFLASFAQASSVSGYSKSVVLTSKASGNCTTPLSWMRGILSAATGGPVLANTEIKTEAFLLLKACSSSIVASGKPSGDGSGLGSASTITPREMRLAPSPPVNLLSILSRSACSFNWSFLNWRSCSSIVFSPSSAWALRTGANPHTAAAVAPVTSPRRDTARGNEVTGSSSALAGPSSGSGEACAASQPRFRGSHRGATLGTLLRERLAPGPG
mmetsp:Transcript_893/g.2903  ORF Transcript_893/g.2903 Transcript_893/m.2903 type:complete len:247 (-) Transcript_893:71-811(-)